LRLTTFALLIEMLELGTLEARQAASLAGLAPVARQSSWTGRAIIRSTRASVRRALYMLAPRASTLTCKPNTQSSGLAASPPRPLSPRSCESSSSSKTPSSKHIGPGHQNQLDQYGYSSAEIAQIMGRQAPLKAAASHLRRRSC